MKSVVFTAVPQATLFRLAFPRPSRTALGLALLVLGLSAASTTTAQVSLSWTDNSIDETGFAVERAPATNGVASAAYAQITTVAGNNATGQITHIDTTAVPGTEYLYRVRAVNLAGNSAYTNVVTNAPTITSQPVASQTVAAFTSVSFTVAATGVPTPTYQWRRNGTNVSGATAATLTIPSADVSLHAGSYTVVVTTNGVSITSNPSVLNVTPIGQTITFGALAGKTFTDAPFTVSASATSSLAVTYAIFSGPATISGNTVTLTGAGTVVVRASQGGNANYNPAANVDQSFAVAKANQTVTFNPLADKSALDAAFAVSATASSSLPITFSIVSGPATASGTDGSTITLTGGGFVVVRASQAGNANYNPAPAIDRGFTVSRVNPVISWSAPAEIKAGTPLSAVQLNATASVPGSFVYTPPQGTLLGVGANQSLSVAFTPTNSAVYNSANGATVLTVTSSKAAPTILAPPSATPITYGQSLAASSLSGGSASVPGTFSFASPESTPGAGAGQVVTVNFIPSDLENFFETSTTTTLTVNPAPVTITAVPTARSISVGQPLSASTLSGGNASIPGAFSFVNPGSILPAGNAQPVAVRFTPNDPVNFAAANGTATITVNKLTQTVAFSAPAGAITVAQPVTLSATATSGLPVTFAVMSGNATISGSSLTVFTTAPVLVRATQVGDATFESASAEALVTNLASGTPAQLYFGKLGTNDLAAAFAPDGRSGRIFTFIAATGEVLIAEVTINADGTFNVVIPGAAPVAAITPGTDRVPAAATANRTFRGRLLNGVLSGSVDELGLSFNGTVQPAAGPTTNLAGIYTASPVATSGASTTYLIVGTQGQVFALTTGANPSAGLGTVSAQGVFQVQTSPTTTLAGTADAASTSITASLQSAGGVTVPLVGLGTATRRDDRLVGLSTRGRVGSDTSRAMIAGLIISGTGKKQVLLRAAGPGLETLGIRNFLSNPQLRLFNDKGAVIAQNDDWSNTVEMDAATTRAGAFKFTERSRDAALLTSLDPGAYTAMVSSDGGSGVALVEVYDASVSPQSDSQQLVDISTRGNVDSGEGVMIAGFAIRGNSPKRVLIRGIGPALAVFGVTGVLADPLLTVYQGSTVVAQNDNWETPMPLSPTQTTATASEIIEATNRAGGFALAARSRDAATVLVLAPGNYTAILTGVGGAGGEALVEVYEVP